MLGTPWVMLIITAIWLAVGAIGPFLIPKGPDRGVYQTMVVTTAICLWLFWFLTYMSQLNPLIGPQLSSGSIYIMKWVWSK